MANDLQNTYYGIGTTGKITPFSGENSERFITFELQMATALAINNDITLPNKDQPWYTTDQGSYATNPSELTIFTQDSDYWCIK